MSCEESSRTCAYQIANANPRVWDRISNIETLSVEVSENQTVRPTVEPIVTDDLQAPVLHRCSDRPGRGRAGWRRASPPRRPGSARRRRRPACRSPSTALPPTWCSGVVFLKTSIISSATRSNSAGPKPRVVSAGVPIRTPLVYQAPLGSDGTELRLVTTPASSSADSACRPVRP